MSAPSTAYTRAGTSRSLSRRRCSEECIDCGACVPACPVAAVYDNAEATPSHQKDLIEANSVYRCGDPEAIAKAEAIVRGHIVAQPILMAIPPAERQAAHGVHFERTSAE